MIRILIADDHTLMRAGLRQILSSCDDLSVGGEAADGFETLRAVRSGEAWDVILLDISMPGRSGVELIRQIKQERPAVRILVLSMHKEDEYAVRTIRAGASGYLCKDSAAEALVDAIRRVASGQHYLSPEVAGELAYSLIVHDDRAPHELLSDREFQIYQLLAGGVGITEIAQRLNLSAKTVSTYKTRLMHKMRMNSVAELVSYGLKRGLLGDPRD